ncbi:MAG: SagB/ThcOx family dehydrogenase [Planctomycetota bacterium]
MTAHEYDELVDRHQRWPASELYHEQSKLTDLRAMELREHMLMYAQQPEPADVRVREIGRSAVPVADVPPWVRGPGLVTALRRRRSWRKPFGRGSVSRRRLGMLLRLGFGVSGRLPVAPGERHVVEGRSWPSAGALYPLELYVLAARCHRLEPGAYRYGAPEHALERVAPYPSVDELRRLILLPEPRPQPALYLVICGGFSRCQEKYGERGYRFMLLEAGHVGQNILLAAEMARLGAVPLGGFCEDALARFLGLDPRRESPLYVIMLGRR